MASKDKIYMVMEFMSGGELFDKIVADGPLEVSTSLLPPARRAHAAASSVMRMPSILWKFW